LHALYDMLRTLEIDDGSSKTLKERDPTKSIDTALFWSLFENLSLEDWKALNITKLPIVSNEIPDSEVDTMKRSIYQNKSKIPGLIKHIGRDFRRLRRAYSIVISIFIFGLIIQLIALVKML